MKNMPEWTNRYVGIPWRETGRNVASGLDCWGLVRLVLMEQANIILPELSDVAYRETGDKRELIRLIRQHSEAMPDWTPVNAPEQVFDVVWLKNPWPIHFGVVVAPGWMIHIEKGCETVLEDFRGLRWGKKLQGIFRHDSR